ncbi:hypothetical protein KFU94_63050 [Chloroflexi bacterium TSY]|nr:hypothetical protein [Chloroflexi bacterium TSY]
MLLVTPYRIRRLVHGCLLAELATLYKSFSNGLPSPLRDLPIQYTDYAAWQRAWMKDDVLQKQLGYWTERLADAPTLLKLPTDRPRPRAQTFRGGAVRFSINTELTQRLRALSQQSGTTLFMTLLAAFQVLLARYSGQDDIVIGSPSANRNRQEVEELIGFFVNTLVLRTDLSDNPSFLDLLA